MIPKNLQKELMIFQQIQELFTKNQKDVGVNPINVANKNGLTKIKSLVSIVFSWYLILEGSSLKKEEVRQGFMAVAEGNNSADFLDIIMMAALTRINIAKCKYNAIT